MKKKIDKINAKKFNNYAVFMANLAYQLLNGKTEIINKKGVKELICLYLLVPYITHETEPSPYYNSNTPKLKENVFDDISNNALRASLCHSHAFVLEKQCDEIDCDAPIILNNRINFKNKKEYSDVGEYNKLQWFAPEYINEKLKIAFNKII